MRRIIAVVVFTAVVVAFRASASASEADGTVTSPMSSVASTLSASGANALSDAAQRARFTLGRFMGRIIEPGVAGMAEKHAAEIAALQPAIRKAPLARQTRAREIDQRRVAADSLAQVMLHDGRPVAALRHAMKARSLVDVVRHQVTEELVR